MEDFYFSIIFPIFVLLIFEHDGIIGIIIADILYKNFIILDDFASLR